MTTTARRGGRFRVALAGIVVAALALRFAGRLWLGETAFWQGGYAFYATLADQLRGGHGYGFPGAGPTAGRLPLYPMLLAALGGSGGFVPIAAAQSAISAGTAGLAGLLARHRWGERAGLAAALAAAVYPYFVVHDTALQESGLFAFLAAAATLVLWRLDRPAPRMAEAVLAGVLLGLAILTRATLAPFAVLAIAWLVWRRREAVLAGIVLAALALTVSPWLVWTHQVTGRVTLSADTGRFLWVANNPGTFAAYPEGSIDRSQEIAFARLAPEERTALFPGNRAAASDRFAARAAAYAAGQPQAVLAGAIRKLGAAFGPMPSPRMAPLETAIYLASWLPVLLLGLAGLWHGRRRWRHDALIYGQFAAFAAVTAVFWAHTSHRAYLDLYLIVFAAGWLATCSRLARRVAA